MTKFAIKYALCFLLLIPAQAIIFNHMILFNVAVPLVFVYLIVMLPVTLGTNLSTFLGFLAGLTLDVFCDTPGVNALCCTVLSFARKPVFHLYVSTDDDLAGRSPSSHTMGYAAYMKFMLTMVLIYS
ncbi:MAG: rod shape-determining protein MreD, partial [Muribaculaceae bacterium]|nr:rod shape-determining protein MreD [Muribaculaceae bacterium]